MIESDRASASDLRDACTWMLKALWAVYDQQQHDGPTPPRPVATEGFAGGVHQSDEVDPLFHLARIKAAAELLEGEEISIPLFCLGGDPQ